MKASGQRDGWVLVGMTVAATSAAIASFAGLRGLAEVAGWPDRLSWLLPITIDAYAMTSTRVWLAGTPATGRARRFARANAIGAIATSIVGNAGHHLVSAGLLTISWPVVVLVGAVPAAVLGLTAHLHALRTVVGAEPDRTPAVQERPEVRPESRTRTRPGRSRTRTDDGLMKAARKADARYRAAHDGRPITRDALRSALRIAGPKATDIRRRLAAETSTRKEAQRNR